MGCPLTRSLFLLAIPLAAGALVGQQTKAIDRAVADLSSPVAAVQIKAMRELMRRGAAVVPALQARLTEVVGTGWETTSYAQPFFLHDDDTDLYCSLDEVSLFWPEPRRRNFLDLETATAVRDDRARRVSDYVGDQVLASARRMLFLLSLCGERAAPVVPQLVELLAHRELAAEAAQALVGIGAPAVPALLAALTDRKRVFAAAQTLAVLQCDRPPVLVRDALVDLLQNGRRSARDGALVALAHMRDVGDAETARAVGALLQTANGTTLRYAIWAIGGMRRHGAAVLLPLLGQDLPPVRLGMLLGAVQLLGEDARGLAGEVLRAAGNGAAPTQVANALAVAGPGSPHEAKAFEFVLQLARDGTLVEQAAGARALGAFGRQVARSAPVLAEMLGEGYLLRRMALLALAALGPGAAVARDDVLAIATQTEPRIDAVTLGTLRGMGAIDDFGATAVQPLLQRYDVELRRLAVRALGAVDAQSAPLLLDWLGEDAVAWSALDGLVALGPAVVPQLAEVLGDASRGQGAARALARIGGKGNEVLLQRMVDADPMVAERAQEALSFGDEAAAQRLLLLLRDGSERERDAAAAILASRDLSALERTQADTLIAAAQAAPLQRRAHLVSALETVQQDRVTAFLVRCVGDDDGEVRLRAVHGLANYHDLERDDVGKALRRALVDPLPSVRQAAAEAVAQAPGEDAPTVALLQRMARADLADERAAALLALGAFGGAAPTSLPLLAAAVGDASVTVRRAAVRGLGQLGSLARERQDAIVLALRDADEDVRFEAREALEAVRPDLAPALQRLRDRDGEPKWNSAIGFGGSRPVVPPAVEEVRAMLAADDVARIVRGLELMRQHFDELQPLRPAVRPLLGHPDSAVRTESAKTLARFGMAEALADIVPLLRDPDPVVRVALLELLRGVDRSLVGRTFDPVAACAADRDPTVRTVAFGALHVLASVDRGFQGPLEVLVRAAAADAAAPVRSRAFAACAGFATLEPATVAVLGQGLDDAAAEVRRAAAGSLAGAGEAALPFVPRLLELGRAGDRPLTAACLRALGKIAPARVDVMWLALDHLNVEDADATDLAPAFAILGS